MNNLKLFVLLFALVSTSVAQAAINGDPKVDKVLLPQQEFTLSTWNIHKEQGVEFLAEFKSLLEVSDIVAVQEGLLTEATKNQWNNDYGFEWNFASAWIDSGGPTGTAVMSRLHVDEALAVITSVTQPIANTPKSSLISYYVIEGTSDRLMVLSTHAINFTFMGPYRTQLNELAAIIQQHPGPVIWTGDFNTWNGSRMDFLLEVTASLGLTLAVMENESRGQKLDHIFTRGVTVESGRVFDQWNTSDHKPLWIKARLN